MNTPFIGRPDRLRWRTMILQFWATNSRENHSPNSFLPSLFCYFNIKMNMKPWMHYHNNWISFDIDYYWTQKKKTTKNQLNSSQMIFKFADINPSIHLEQHWGKIKRKESIESNFNSNDVVTFWFQSWEITIK